MSVRAYACVCVCVLCVTERARDSVRACVRACVTSCLLVLLTRGQSAFRSWRTFCCVGHRDYVIELAGDSNGGVSRMAESGHWMTVAD